MTQTRTYAVGEAAALSGISVRTLHHYDDIGLLVPSSRSSAGYRQYSEEDLLRLQQILIGRSLGLSLADIGQSLDDPVFDFAESLRAQRALLLERVAATHKMIAAVDAALARLDAEAPGVIDLKTLFDGFDPAAYEAEAQERWGETDAYKESARRTARYSEADWQTIKAELDGIWTDAAKAMGSGERVDSPAAADIVARHRAHISRWFYDLSPEAHTQLADLWEADRRYAETIDKYADGLTEWVAAAVRTAHV